MTMAHRLGEPWWDVECMGNDGDLTKASIDTDSSSHSVKKIQDTIKLTYNGIVR